jgi:hypothetical protein
MNSRWLNAIALITIAALCGGLTLFGWGSTRMLAALLLDLFLPGWALLSLLEEQDLELPIRSAIAIGLSVMLTVLIGIGLQFAPGGLTATSIVLALLTVTLACALYSVRRGYTNRSAFGVATFFVALGFLCALSPLWFQAANEQASLGPVIGVAHVNREPVFSIEVQITGAQNGDYLAVSNGGVTVSSLTLQGSDWSGRVLAPGVEDGDTVRVELISHGKTLRTVSVRAGASW